MKPFYIDSALYLLSDSFLKGSVGVYIEDLIRCGDSDFLGFGQKTKKKFEVEDESVVPLDCTGCLIRQENDGAIPID